jgi:uncharacterized protein YbbC (DUF1343 family)
MNLRRSAAFALLLAAAGTAHSPAQPVSVGADLLVAGRLDLVSGKRVGLVVNHTARTADGTHLVDALRSRGIAVVRLFGPEHGVRGAAAAGEKVADGVDPATGIPVVSLYGKIQKPTREMLKDVDILLYDIQDVGARFYTYISTMKLCMEAAADRGIPFVVLDRPNPLGGVLVDGPILEDSLRSFVGCAPLPVVYGLTAGELARYLTGERLLAGGAQPELIVLPIRGWERKGRWESTGLPWVPPSPNLPTSASAIVYPATCIVEATNLSEGRGTASPFQVVGAPFLDPLPVANALNSLSLPGVRFDTTTFVPTASKHRGVRCRGIVVQVTDPGVFEPTRTGLHLLRAILTRTSEATVQRRSFLRLMGSERVYGRFMAGADIDEIAAGWEGGRIEFAERRAKYLLYP